METANPKVLSLEHTLRNQYNDFSSKQAKLPKTKIGPKPNDREIRRLTPYTKKRRILYWTYESNDSRVAIREQSEVKSFTRSGHASSK